MNNGWISLHRKVLDHPFYKEKRTFSKFEAWIDLLLMASHKDTQFMLGNELIEIEKGSFVTSEIKLMERWGWGKAKLRSFLEMLENDSMIVKKSDRKKTTISICNYCVYQDAETKNKPQANHEQTNSKPIAYTINNINKDNKNIYSSVINYLNEKAGTNFKPTSKKTQKFIKSRLNENFTLEDFQTVIDIKVGQWKNDSYMSKYLRPETLFGPKFEAYLNERPGSKPVKSTTQTEQKTVYKPFNFDDSRGE